MKKILIILFIASIILVSLGVVSADSFSIGSDNTAEWSSDSISWNNAVETWIHPAWPTITDAKWIWRTAQTNPQDEYATVPDGGWYFKQTFEIPECADESTFQGTITAASDNAYEMYFNGVYVDGRGVYEQRWSRCTKLEIKNNF